MDIREIYNDDGTVSLCFEIDGELYTQLNATVLFHALFETFYTFYISNYLSFSIHRQRRISVL